MQLDPNDPVFETAVFGAEVEQFLDSNVGKYLIDRATEEANTAMEALVKVDAEDAKAIRLLQNRVQVADWVVTWLREAIVTGEVAAQKLREDA